MNSKKMKALLVIAVMTCVFVIGQVQNSDCVSRLSGLSSCTSQLAANGGGNFCNDCANQLISYYRDCTNGVGVAAVQRHKLDQLMQMAA